MDEYFDLVIIGGGPAGYGAALYGVTFKDVSHLLLHRAIVALG
mgnify:CR=1 FL=1